jgi:hypothetical protein
LKIELTKSNAYCETNFGEFLDIKRKGRVPAVSQVATGKKHKKLRMNPRKS